MASGVYAAQRRRWRSVIFSIVGSALLASAGQAENSNPNHNGDFDGNGMGDNSRQGYGHGD